MVKCASTEKAGHILEAQVFTAIEGVLLDPQKLRGGMDIFKTQRPHARMERERQRIEKSLRKYSERKQRITDIYAAGKLSREEYVTKSLAYDNEINILIAQKTNLLQRIPLFRKKSLIEDGIEQYCEGAKLRYKKAVDFETKRQFLLDYVEKVTYWNNKIAVHGSVPVTIKSERGRESETSKIEFRIETDVNRIAARAERMRSGRSPRVTVT